MQSEHSLAPASLNVPARQATGSEAPEAHDVPAGHVEHVDAFVAPTAFE